MAGMYPDNENLEFFGETVSWPGVDENGKFTNGNFSNPKEPPSYIPAQTINLILDNLSELLIALGETPNNQSSNQLALAVMAAFNAEVEERTAADHNLRTAILAISPEIDNNVQTVLNILEEIRNLINTHKTAATLDHPNGSVTTAKIANDAVTFAKIAAAAKSTTTPKISGTADIGTELAFARGDHIHPSELTAKDLGNVDFNTVKSPGYYVVKSATNAPTTNATAYLVNVYSGNGAIIQDACYYTATGGSRARWWRKQNNGGSWEAWAQIAVKDEVAADLLKIVNIQSGNLIFEGDWSFSSAGVLTKGSSGLERLISFPTTKAQSIDGYIDWITHGAAWPTITGLGSTPSIAGGHAITIPICTAIIGRHTRGGERTDVAFYALRYNLQPDGIDLLQPGDIYICGRTGDMAEKLHLGNGLTIGGGVSIVNGGVSDSNKANIASPNFTGTPKITDASGSQNRIAVVAATGEVNETDLPVGSYVLVAYNIGTDENIKRNCETSMYLVDNAGNRCTYTRIYMTYAVQLSGTWRTCGGSANNYFLARRVA